MAYSGRLLPPEDYWLLEAHGIPHDRMPHPGTSLVGVIEKDARIVGRWMALNTIVLEGLKIDEAYQKHPGVARRLLHLMMSELKDRKIEAVTTIIHDERVGELARHAGFYRLPGVLYQKDLRDK